MLEIPTKVIRKLGFEFCGRPAICVLAEYMDNNTNLLSIKQQISPLTKFIIYIKDECSGKVTEVSTKNYISKIFETKNTGANIIQSYLKSFVTFLCQNGYCEQIVFERKKRATKNTQDDEVKNNQSTNKNQTEESKEKPNTENTKQKTKKVYQKLYSYKYYDIFLIACDASMDEIKKAYHKIAKQYHPDLCHDVYATERFASINHIYEILSNENERFEYDVTMGFIDGYTTTKKKKEYSVFFPQQ